MEECKFCAALLTLHCTVILQLLKVLIQKETKEAS